jgi:hypothetical protein
MFGDPNMRRTSSMWLGWMSIRNLKSGECPSQKSTRNLFGSVLSLSPSASKVVCLPHYSGEDDSSSMPHSTSRLVSAVHSHSIKG